jgi:hypothetical protein
MRICPPLCSDFDWLTLVLGVLVAGACILLDRLAGSKPSNEGSSHGKVKEGELDDEPDGVVWGAREFAGNGFAHGDGRQGCEDDGPDSGREPGV